MQSKDDEINKTCERWNIPSIGDVADVVTMQSHIESIKQKAHVEATEQGTKQGYDEGFQQGLNQAAEDVAHLKAQVVQLLNVLNNPVLLINNELEQAILQLNKTIAERVILQEITISPIILQNIIQSAMGLLDNQEEKCTVHMAPEDIELLKTVIPEEQYAHCELIADGTLSQGDCIINNGKTKVDASVTERINLIMKDLLEESQ